MRLIDSDELIKQLIENADAHALNPRDHVLMGRDRQIVREMPTIEAVAEHTQWMPDASGMGVHCLQCGGIISVSEEEYREKHLKGINYCPYCGRKVDMRY